MRLLEESDLPEDEKNRVIIELARELGKRLLEQEAGRSGHLSLSVDMVQTRMKLRFLFSKTRILPLHPLSELVG